MSGRPKMQNMFNFWKVIIFISKNIVQNFQLLGLKFLFRLKKIFNSFGKIIIISKSGKDFILGNIEKLDENSEDAVNLNSGIRPKFNFHEKIQTQS